LRSKAPPQIPDCPYCHAPRQFEFQLQPQLLQYIIHRDNSSFSSVDLSQKEALLAACAIVNKTAPEELPPQFKETHDKALQRIQPQLSAKPKMIWTGVW
jgi:Programmed cell death protein 2, C-terminal putative domain